MARAKVYLGDVLQIIRDRRKQNTTYISQLYREQIGMGDGLERSANHRFSVILHRENGGLQGILRQLKSLEKA